VGFVSCLQFTPQGRRRYGLIFNIRIRTKTAAKAAVFVCDVRF
jgi:hypothetical protein